MSTPVLVFMLVTAASGAESATGDQAPPVISFVPCEVVQKGRAFTVFARFEDASPVFEPKLVYRVSGESAWRNAPFKAQPGGTLWRASVAARELRGALEYFVEVFDENGNGPARVGSPEQPLFARLVRRAPECAHPDRPSAIALAPIETSVVPEPSPSSGSAQTESPAPSPMIATATSTATSTTMTAPAATSGQPATSRCKQDAPPLYCKYWFWIATGGAVVATTAIIIAAEHGSSRDYPDHVTLVVQQRALEPAR